jgi:fructose-specific phosphotransferase system component IIB
MMQHSPADQQILAILATLQEAVGGDGDRLTPDEVARARVVLAHAETLVAIARYEEAKGLFWAHWRGVVLGAAAMLSALAAAWANSDFLIAKFGGLFK